MDTKQRVEETNALRIDVGNICHAMKDSEQTSFELDQARVKLQEAGHWLAAHMDKVYARADADCGREQEKLPLPEREAAGEAARGRVVHTVGPIGRGPDREMEKPLEEPETQAETDVDAASKAAGVAAREAHGGPGAPA
jgi:hypothetical protein